MIEIEDIYKIILNGEEVDIPNGYYLMNGSNQENIELFDIYDDVGLFSEGLVAVKRNNKWGYVNKLGFEIVSCKYDYVYPFSLGLAIVVNNNKYGIIDKNGKEIVSCELNLSTEFPRGLDFLKQNYKCEFIDKNGKTVYIKVNKEIIMKLKSIFPYKCIYNPKTNDIELIKTIKKGIRVLKDGNIIGEDFDTGIKINKKLYKNL